MACFCTTPESTRLNPPRFIFTMLWSNQKSSIAAIFGGSFPIVFFWRQSLKASTLPYRWWIILHFTTPLPQVKNHLFYRYFHGKYFEEIHSPVSLVRTFTVNSYHIIDTMANHSHSFRIGKMAVWFEKRLKIRYFMEQIFGKILLRLLRSSRTIVICPSYTHNLKFIRP